MPTNMVETVDTDLLMGRLSQADAIPQTPYHSLHFLGCGTRTAEAPELLGSSVMLQLMAALRSSYSVVIVDSPPLGAGVDAFSLGTLTGNLLMVLRLGSTDRELAEAKLDVLDRLPVRVLGAVLNDVREGSAYRYYRYYSYYLPGYEQVSEETGVPLGSLKRYLREGLQELREILESGGFLK